ncbi:MAG: TlpA family protein disulfide reductase [Bacteroidales bacterium]|nr:TlpA family protein disulfide reductase [Bacteroidales bacterium]
MMFADFEVGGNKFSDYVGKGKYVLVDFWASWCGPCKAEVPNIKNVYEKYSGNDFEVLGVAVWDKPLATAKAIKDLELPWNQIVNAQSIPTDIYGIEGIPHIILFGPDGKIVKRNLRGDEIEAEVAKYVKPVK